ncbi:unnamed protein product [Symbiodinium pilosum]|uniref:Uncharacterized protein n=1 Tax=Symbiodinium pilosum TaxID=2952 RepID=A0A812LVH2_SYMPI|nr:unnamed protein product [Symbiodinium pilosum]
MACFRFSLATLLMLPALADFLAPTSSRILQQDSGHIELCHDFDYAQCLGGMFGRNVTDSVKSCCERPVRNAWQTVRQEMPWWGWPLLALGVVVLITCCVTCLVRMGCDLLWKIICCPCRSCCRCLCGSSK